MKIQFYTDKQKKYIYMGNYKPEFLNDTVINSSKDLSVLFGSNKEITQLKVLALKFEKRELNPNKIVASIECLLRDQPMTFTINNIVIIENIHYLFDELNNIYETLIKDNGIVFPMLELMICKNIAGEHRIGLVSASPCSRYSEKDNLAKLQWIRCDNILNNTIDNNIITDLNKLDVNDMNLNESISKTVVKKPETITEQEQLTNIDNEVDIDSSNKDYIDDDGLEVIEPQLPAKKEDTRKSDSSSIKEELLKIKMIEEDIKNIDLGAISKEWKLDFIKSEEEKQTLYKTYKDDEGLEIILPKTSLEDKTLSEDYLTEDEKIIEEN